MVAVAEVGEELLRRQVNRLFPLEGLDFTAIFALCRDGNFDEAGTVGDLLAELVAGGELLPRQAHDVVGVGVVLGEDERLRHFLPVWESGVQHGFPELAQHGADLAHGHYVPVHLVGRVGEVVRQQLQAFPPCQLVALLHIHSARRRRDSGTFRRDAGSDAVHIEVHVHAIHHGILMAVLHHQILVEKAERLAGRRGR